MLIHTVRILTFALALLPVVINALPAPADELVVRGKCLCDQTHFTLTYATPSQADVGDVVLKRDYVHRESI